MSNSRARLAIIDPVGSKAGMNYYNSSLMEAMSKFDIDCLIYSNYEPENESSVQYHRVFGSDRLNSVFSVFSLGVGAIRSCWGCKSRNIDTVILHQFNTNIVTLCLFLMVRSFGFRILTIAHDIESFANDDIEFSRGLIYNHLSAFVTVHNDYSFQCIQKYLSKKQVSNVYIARQGHYGLYQGTNLSKNTAREKLNLSEEKKYLLFFGQIKEAKGLKTLLHAINDIPDEVELIVAGRPWKTTSEQYENLVEELGIRNRVILKLRFIEDEERDLLFQACDVAVLPYNEIYESAVLIMSLTYGLAVVASSLPIFEEIVGKSKAGELFPVGDSEKLSVAIKKLTKDKSVMRFCGDNGRGWVNSHHSWMESARVHHDVLYEKSQ